MENYAQNSGEDAHQGVDGVSKRGAFRSCAVLAASLLCAVLVVGSPWGRLEGIDRAFLNGEQIVRARALTVPDPFLWSRGGVEVSNSFWLSDLTTFALSSFGQVWFRGEGVGANLLFILLALTGFLGLNRALERPYSGQTPNRITLLLLVAFFLAPLPKTPSDLWLLALFPLLLAHRLSTKRSSWLVIGVVSSVATFASPNGIFFPVFLLLTVVGARFDGSPASSLAPPAIGALLSLATVLCSPGVAAQLLLWPVSWSSPEEISTLGEVILRTEDTHKVPALKYLIVLSIGAAAAATRPLRWSVLLPTVFALFGALFTGEGAIFLVLLLPFLLGDVFEGKGDSRNISRRAQTLSPWLITGCYFVAFAVAPLLSLPDKDPRVKDLPVGTAATPRLFAPMELAAAVQREGVQTFIDERIFPTRFEPTRFQREGGEPVPVTGSLVGDYLQVNEVRERWEEVLERWLIDSVLLPDDHPLISLLKQRGWSELGRSSQKMEIRRGVPKFVSLIVLSRGHRTVSMKPRESLPS